MNELKRETLGRIWRLCEQMAYAAENGHVAILQAEFGLLQNSMSLLGIIENDVLAKAGGNRA